MAKITNDLKRIHRVAAIITRAIERCFASADISCLSCQFYNDEFNFELSSTLFDYTFINVHISDKKSDKCVAAFIKKLLTDLNKITKELESEERELRRDMKRYDVAFGESQAVTLSSVLMLRQIVESIKY